MRFNKGLIKGECDDHLFEPLSKNFFSSNKTKTKKTQNWSLGIWTPVEFSKGILVLSYRLIISAFSHYFWSKMIVAVGTQLDIDCMSVKLMILYGNRGEKSRYILKTLLGVRKQIPISKKNTWIGPPIPTFDTVSYNCCREPLLVGCHLIWFWVLRLYSHPWKIHCVMRVWVVISIFHSKYCQETV